MSVRTQEVLSITYTFFDGVAEFTTAAVGLLKRLDGGGK